MRTTEAELSSNTSARLLSHEAADAIEWPSSAPITISSRLRKVTRWRLRCCHCLLEAFMVIACAPVVPSLGGSRSIETLVAS